MASQKPQSLMQQHAGQNSISTDGAWNDLQGGIVDVLQHKAMTKKRYLDLYNLVYKYCTSCSVTTTSENYRQREQRSTEFLGQQLYGELTKFLRDYLCNKSKEGSDKIDDVVLAFYSDVWKYFTFSSQVIHNIFLYLNRHWVRREMEDGNKKIYEIYSLSLVSWRDHFLGMEKTTVQPLEAAVRAAFLRLIECERNGKPIESKFIQCIVQSYVELGIENMSSSRGRILTFYKQNFETHFFRETRDYYQKESCEFLSKNSVTKYVGKADTRLNEEKSRADRLLHETTLAPLITLCEKILIAQYLQRFFEEFQNLLDHEKTDDIARMYRLVSRVKESAQPMKVILQEHIKRQGLSAIESIRDRAQSEPQTYAREILRILNTYKAMVMKAFSNEPLFVQALDEACTHFINNNAVIKEAKNKNKTSELLARYSDLLLKKSSKVVEEAELEDVLQQIVILLRYIEDKDVFNRYYMNKFAKRLIDHLSISEDAERSMIAKLKEAFGNTYTSKLEKMFQDVELSKGLNERFRAHIETMGSKPEIDFGIQVLTQGQWPYPMSGTLALPTELDGCIQKFRDFYSAQHSGRKLSWNYAQSSGDINGNFKRRYTFTVSTYQMVVLLQFNIFTSRTFQQLQENTQIRTEDLQQVLRILLKMKILLGENIPQNETEAIPDTAVLSVYQQYQHKKVRLNLNIPLRIEAKQEEEATNRIIEDERRYETEAAIVRVMKTRRELKHNELMSEVIQLLKPRFQPKVQHIKVRIEDLIQRDYLKRAEGQKDVYHYVA